MLYDSRNQITNTKIPKTKISIHNACNCTVNAALFALTQRILRNDSTYSTNIIAKLIVSMISLFQKLMINLFSYLRAILNNPEAQQIKSLSNCLLSTKKRQLLIVTTYFPLVSKLHSSNRLPTFTTVVAIFKLQRTHLSRH